MSQKTFTITEETVIKLIGYLQQKPYIEVHQLFKQLDKDLLEQVKQSTEELTKKEKK
jgi:hypothetical protein